MMSLEDKASHVIEFVRKQMQANGFPGMGISVVYQHKTAIVQGLGTTAVNSSLPVLPSTQFAIGGLSHTLLALAVAKLVYATIIITESHELEWNDPISMYLPWFSLMDEYAASHTTVGDLLSHNSVRF
ncbi:hypothetical protein AaE_007607 [Aphanomyces astaci]|uniref:Beta-lactamase-related domain-containing protein n=1 Tax=Aphanomyces astaci TaxID=112090 RepID=A0A6A5AG57_APHAT|nr:hypothetical protein AaE_007607 [Aphanomyces astaci]